MDKVPIVEVDLTNVSDILPSLILAIKTSSFIALDLELSGLGNRKLLTTSNIEDRYKHICEVANSRSILALGVSCFKQQDTHKKVAYLSQSFNIVTMCMDNYIIEPASIKFLSDHGFNFNRQYSSGLSYHRSNMEYDFQIKEGISKQKSKKKPKNVLFSESILSIILKQIIIQNVPIVLHNALVDLVFLYCNLYSNPPDKLTQFIADVHLMFPAGVVDTKVIAEFKDHMQASYLDYVFKKCQRDNSKEEDKKSVSMEFVSYSPLVQHYLTHFDCSLLEDQTVLNDPSQSLCSNYANHGWCVNGVRCGLSHNIQLVLCFEEDLCHNQNTTTKSTKLTDDERINSNGRLKKKTRSEVNYDGGENIYQLNQQACNEITKDDNNRNEINTNNINNSTSNNNSINNDNNKSNSSSNNNNNNSHGAGIDAFMTGFALAHFLNKYKEEGEEESLKVNYCTINLDNGNKNSKVVHNDDVHNNVNHGSTSRSRSDLIQNDCIDDEENTKNYHENSVPSGADAKNYVTGVMKALGSVDFKRECIDRVYLCGKDFTLKVAPSQFVKPSNMSCKLLSSLKL